MASGKHVSYLRVSTAKQGASGLGLEAQREAVLGYLNGGHWTLVAEYVEIESGKRNDRPQLAAALAHARAIGARLVIAKLDRLSRDAHFLLGLDKAGVDFVAADLPTANRLTVGIMAMVAEEERRAISARTKAALAAAKARGVRLGSRTGGAHLRGLGNAAAVAAGRENAERRAADLGPIIAAIREAGHDSLGAIARELNARGILTARGGTWHASTVRNLLARLDA
ncbi:Resolvase domain [Methylobacterium sp. 4-46]|uniref:recombinase family protein n=1 Tax=unclassified Methylobacterium TaxID=2615210 RepID=UPI000152C57A|nr:MULTISPECIES: recombinase family protein [Methylobacterium]ACA15748.1 Resolvase domain [Methylobacterium sp. 4-46]WFT81481.1 recombinase family protein [Methylobacterium nodulans]